MENMSDLDCFVAKGGEAAVSRSSFGQKVVTATFWSAVCLWSNRLLTLLFFAVLARLLSPEAFGLLALSMVYVGFLAIFQEQGFAQAVIQREDLHADHLNTAFWMNLGFAGSLTLITLLGAPFVGSIFHEPDLPRVLRGLSPLFIIGALVCVQRALLHRRLDFRSLAIASVVGVSTGGVIGTLAALKGFGVWSLVFHQITARACESLVIWWRSDWRPCLRWRRAHFWDLFGFGKYVVGSQLASFAQIYAPDIIIGLLWGSAAVGLFDVAYRCIRMVLQMISGVVSKVSLPAFSRLQQEPERGRAAFLTMTTQIALLSFPVFVGIAVLAPEIVATVFGQRWERAVPAMRALSFVGLLQSICYLMRPLILANGRPKWYFRLELLGVGLTVTALLATVHAGIVAVAWSQVLATAVSCPVLFWAVSKLLGVNAREYIRSLLSASVGSIAMAMGMVLVRAMVATSVGPVWTLALALLIGVFIFCVTVWVVDPSALQRSLRYVHAAVGTVRCGATRADAL